MRLRALGKWLWRGGEPKVEQPPERVMGAQITFWVDGSTTIVNESGYALTSLQSQMLKEFAASQLNAMLNRMAQVLSEFEAGRGERVTTVVPMSREIN